MTQLECATRYKALKTSVLEQIREIDQDTPADSTGSGVPVEPLWWLEMMELQRYVKGLL